MFGGWHWNDESDRSVTSLLLVTSNGAGMGHLSRQLSIGLAAPPGVQSTVLSLSMALPQVLELGIPGEYCPSYEREWMPRRFWNRYLRTRVVALASEVEADVVLFDGVAPYRGLLATRPYLPDTAFIWVRRGMWLPHTTPVNLDRSSQFDRVLEPGDLAKDADRGPTMGRSDALLIPPISMVEVIDRPSRTESATMLGLDPQRPTVLLTLGSGRLGDIAAPGRVALEALLEHKGWQVAMTTAAIATSDIAIPDPTRVVGLRGVYPLARYLNAFDAVVSAAGYNAVHEFVSGGIPTLLVPNRATKTDDQGSRAHGVANRGLALVAEADDPDGIHHAIDRLLDESQRRQLRLTIDTLAPHERMGGAARAAEIAVSTVERHRGTLGMRARGTWRVADDGARTAAMSVLGPTGTDLVRRALRRPALDGIKDRLPVRIVGASDPADQADGETAPLLFSESVTVNDTTSDHLVEHLVAGASEQYLQRRMAIVERNYRLRSM